MHGRQEEGPKARGDRSRLWQGCEHRALGSQWVPLHSGGSTPKSILVFVRGGAESWGESRTQGGHGSLN